MVHLIPNREALPPERWLLCKVHAALPFPMLMLACKFLNRSEAVIQFANPIEFFKFRNISKVKSFPRTTTLERCPLGAPWIQLSAAHPYCHSCIGQASSALGMGTCSLAPSTLKGPPKRTVLRKTVVRMWLLGYICCGSGR